MKNNITPGKITFIYGSIQGWHWMAALPYMMYAAVFLQYRGMTNAQIGYAISAAAVGSMVLQMVLSSFSDRSQRVSLKAIIATIYIVLLFLGAVLSFITYPTAMLMTIFIMGYMSISSVNSLLNAMFMQIKNTGLDVNFGLPRGAGSISFAVAGYVLGKAIESYSPAVLFPVQTGLTLFALLFVLLMPKPEQISGVHPDKVNVNCRRNTFAMLKENPTMIAYMFAVIMTFSGNAYFSFLINIIRDLGGNTKDLGVAIFLNASLEIFPMVGSAWLLKKFGSEKLIKISIIAFLVKNLTITFAGTIGWVYLATIASIFSNGIYLFATVYFINEIVLPNERTRGQALIGICASGGLGTVIGTSICGMMLDSYGIDAMMIYSDISVFIGVILMFATSALHKKHFVIKTESENNSPQR